MAKPFYTLEEVCEKLGKSADEVKAMVRDGILREFRDAGKVFFKSEDVNRAAAGDSGEIILEPGDEDALPSMIDSSGGTSVIGLAPLDEDEPAPARPAPKPAPTPAAKKKEDTAVMGGGLGIFGDEAELDADPLEKTQITSGGTDQVSLEGTGTGSGLLDLTRESDDTSLGEVLDEIYPGEEEPAPAAPPKRAAPKAAAPVAAKKVEEEEPIDSGTLIAPVLVPTGDPQEGIMGGLLGAALTLLAVSAIVASGALQGNVPGFAETLSNQFLYLLIGSVLVLGLGVLVGWFVGKAAGGRR